MFILFMVMIYAFYLYLAGGFIISCWFSFFKIGKTDPAAAGSSFWFRIIIMPATILLWPIVLLKLSDQKINE